MYVRSYPISIRKERMLQYVSQSLSETPQKYSQVDKEAYAIIFGIKMFYQFLYGITLITLYCIPTTINR